MLFILCLCMSTALPAASFTLEEYCTSIQNRISRVDPFDFQKYCGLEKEIRSAITAIRKLQYPDQWHCEICDRYFDKKCTKEKHEKSKTHKKFHTTLIRKTDESMYTLDCKIKRLKPLVIPE